MVQPYFRSSVLLLALTAAGALWAAGPVEVTLDFTRYRLQIEAGDGGSVCQFHGSDPVKGTIAADRAYSTLRGFPDDSSGTEFGKFCDVAFSTRGTQGMGLQQVWSTPAIFQSPPGSLGKKYDPASWAKLDFSMYEADPLPKSRYTAKDVDTPRGHTVPMLLAALRRARAEGQRILVWNDLHTDYPHWMWQDGKRSNPIPEEFWEEAALHVVYYAKYLAARHGIPIHTVSLQNEPDLPNRHAFTPEMLVRMSKILRAKLDEAGLTGVRIMPYTSVGLGTVRLDWRNVTVTTLDDTQKLLEGPLSSHLPYIDSLGGHLSQSEPPFRNRLRNTAFWRASGDFDNHYKGHGSVTFDMGPDNQIDEVIRLNTWLYGQGVSLAGIWQIALRMGHTVDNFVLPDVFDAAKTFRHAAIDGAAVVYPYVRPGMFLVEGSQSRPAGEPYSVDGFAGRGHKEVAIVSNSGEEREFVVRFGGIKALALDIYQATASSRKRHVGRQRVSDGAVRIRVPADSVTSLVLSAPQTRPMLVMVVKDAARMTAAETALQRRLETTYDLHVVSQQLTAAEQDRFRAKRHPVDPMGTAAYVLSESVDGAAAYSYRTVMAPVIALGESARKALGVASGGSVAGGEPLSFRDPLDPPASMLDGGLPKACGPRAHSASGAEGVAAALSRFVPKG